MAVIKPTQIQSRLFHLKGDVCESEGGEGQTEGGRGEGHPRLGSRPVPSPTPGRGFFGCPIA